MFTSTSWLPTFRRRSNIKNRKAQLGLKQQACETSVREEEKPVALLKEKEENVAVSACRLRRGMQRNLLFGAAVRPMDCTAGGQLGVLRIPCGILPAVHPAYGAERLGSRSAHRADHGTL